MLEGGHADGLEVWLACLSSNTFVNIMQEDSIWLSSCESVNFTFLTFVLSNYGLAVPCLPEEEGQMDVASPAEEHSPSPMTTRSMATHPQGG